MGIFAPGFPGPLARNMGGKLRFDFRHDVLQAASVFRIWKPLGRNFHTHLLHQPGSHVNRRAGQRRARQCIAGPG